MCTRLGTVGGQLEGDDRAGGVTGDMRATEPRWPSSPPRRPHAPRSSPAERWRAADLAPLVVPDQAVALDQRPLGSSGKKLSAMGPVLIRSTGSPDPFTSYSNSTPLTLPCP